MALESGGTLCALWVSSLSLDCARPYSKTDIEQRPLNPTTSYGLHVGLQVDLVQICAGAAAGRVTHYVTQGALRVASLMQFYGTSRFKVLCRVQSVVRLSGNSDEELFKIRVSVLGEQLKRDLERPVSMYDILHLLKRISKQVVLSGRNAMHHVKAACKEILNTAGMKVPADSTLERIGSFVMAVESIYLLNFAKCPAINIHIYSFVFKPSWKQLCSDSDSMQLVLRWLFRGMRMTNAVFHSLFNAFVAGGSRTGIQNEVVGAYKSILDASTEEAREQAWRFLKASASRVKPTGSTSSSGPSEVELIKDRSTTVSGTICLFPPSSLSALAVAPLPGGTVWLSS